MSIRVNDEWEIKFESSAPCWTLRGVILGDVNPKTGKKMKTIDQTCHGTLQQACKYLLSKMAKEPKDLKTVKDLMNSINRSERIITEALNKRCIGCLDCDCGKIGV